MGKEFTGESAFVDAYSEYFDVVYREALRYSGNHHVAEEIAQDAFFMAYVQNGNESKQQIKAWMLMLAKYRAMNYIRDHKREVSLEEITMSEDEYPDALVDDSSEEYVIAMLKEQGFRKLGIDIFRELYQKKARWYQAVTLVYYVDMPQKEAAKQMGVTLYALEGYAQFEYIKDELKDLFALTDLVISRAGANAICELLALHKPNLLIPLSANASRGDQILNARSFERQGYSVVLEEEELNHDVLLKAITDLYQNRETYIQAMKNSPQQNSIDTIIDLIESVARH